MRKKGKGLTRRDFLELTAVGAAGVAASGVGVPNAFGAAPKRGGTATCGMSFLMHSPDPQRWTGYWARQSTGLCYEGLTQPVSIAERARIVKEKGPDFVPDVQPMLSEGWDIEKDGARYVFHLKKGVKFHNGKEFDSADVEWSWKRIQDPVHRAGGRKMLTTYLKSIETPDKYTVVANLTQPYFAFPAANAWHSAAILPKDTMPQGAIWGETPTFKPPTTAPPGTGPFEMVVYEQKRQAVYQGFKDYRIAGLPYLDKVVFKIISDDTPRTIAVRAGDVDYIWNADATWQNTVLKGKREDWLNRIIDLKKEGLSFFLKMRSTSYALWLNANDKPGVSPFKDERVRQALDYSIDKEKLGKVLFGDLIVTAGQGFHPDVSPWGYEDIKPKARDIEKAKKLLKEAGYPDGLDVEFKFTPSWGKNDKMAQIVQQMARPAGFRIKLTSLLGGAYWGNLRKASYHIMVYALGGDDPMGFYYGLGHTDPAEPFNGYSGSLWIKDPDLDKLLDDMAAETDLMKRKVKFKKVVLRFNEKSYAIPYGWAVQGPVWRTDKLKNFKPMNYFFPEQAFREAWVEG